MIWIPPLILVASLVVLGDALLRSLASRRASPGPGSSRADSAGVPLARSWALAFATGAVILHAVLLGLSLSGLRWWWWLPPALALGAWLWARRSPSAGGARGGEPGLDWSDAVAAAVWCTVAGLALGAALVNPDFVYHWGVKARKFALAGGLDFAFLGPPSGWHLHPDYPTLLPELLSYATGRRGAALAGADGPMVLVSLLLFGGFLLAARDAWRAVDARPLVRRVGFAFTTLLCGSFAIAAELPGNADPLIAWSLLLALPPLLAPRRDDAPVRIGVAAALAAAAKIEGVPLGTFLLLAWSWAGSEAGRGGVRSGVRRLLPLALPYAAVVLPWLWIDVTHHLFSPQNSGAPSLARLLSVLPALGHEILGGAWEGVALLLLALPALLFWPRGRAAAAVVLAQLGFYVWVYATAPVDSPRYVAWSFARLLFHLLPTTFVLLAAWFADRAARPDDAEAGSSIASGRWR